MKLTLIHGCQQTKSINMINKYGLAEISLSFHFHDHNMYTHTQYSTMIWYKDEHICVYVIMAISIFRSASWMYAEIVYRQSEREREGGREIERERERVILQKAFCIDPINALTDWKTVMNSNSENKDKWLNQFISIFYFIRKRAQTVAIEIVIEIPIVVFVNFIGFICLNCFGTKFTVILYNFQLVEKCMGYQESHFNWAIKHEITHATCIHSHSLARTFILCAHASVWNPKW